MHYAGTTDMFEVSADDLQFKEGSIVFVEDRESWWKKIAIYPADKTIVYRIENLKS